MLVCDPLDFNVPFEVRNTYTQQTLAFSLSDKGRDTMKGYFNFKLVLNVSFFISMRVDASHTS